MNVQNYKFLKKIHTRTHTHTQQHFGPKLSYGAAVQLLRKLKVFIAKRVIRYLGVENVDDLPERGLTRVTKKQDNEIIRWFRLIYRKFKPCQMRQIYQKYHVISAKKLFGPNETNWVLREDNGPKHRSHLYAIW